MYGTVFTLSAKADQLTNGTYEQMVKIQNRVSKHTVFVVFDHTESKIYTLCDST